MIILIHLLERSLLGSLVFTVEFERRVRPDGVRAGTRSGVWFWGGEWDRDCCTCTFCADRSSDEWDLGCDEFEIDSEGEDTGEGVEDGNSNGSGDGEEDKEYYDEHITKLIEKIFDLNDDNEMNDFTDQIVIEIDQYINEIKKRIK